MKHPIRVMVADDHPVVASGLEVLLESRSEFRLVGYAGTAVALEALLRTKETDLLILDLGLGSSNGLGVLRMVKETYPSLMIIVFSMYSEEGVIQSALRMGASAFVNKQDPPGHLLTAMESVIKGGTWQAPVRISKGRPAPGSWKDLLTPREIVIFELLGEGLKTRDIAAQLGVSVKTVESHRENIKVKLGLNSAEQLIAAAARCSSGAVAVPLLP